MDDQLLLWQFLAIVAANWEAWEIQAWSDWAHGVEESGCGVSWSDHDDDGA